MLEIINEKTQEMSENGTLESIIKDRTEQAVNKAMDEVFSSWGAFNKVLKKSLEEQIEAQSWNFKLEPHTAILIQFVKEGITKHLEGEANTRINEMLDSMFKPVPKTITMQEIVTRVRDAWKDDDYDNDRDEHLSLKCTKSEYGWYTLKLWKQKEEGWSHRTKERNADIEIHIGSEGAITWLCDGNRNYGAHNYNVESFIYRMTIARTVISDIRECNEDEFDDTYIGIGED